MSGTTDERLRQAAEQGDREGVEAALAEGADLASADSTFGNTALHLAAPLGFIDMARRYRHQPPSVVRLHPWMQDLVPHTLRLALAGVA